MERISRPVQWPSTLTRGLRTAASRRGVHLAARHPQLGVHAGHDDVELGERVRLLVERTVIQDVDLDSP
ncbi:hypothetical protein [Naumannella huperziae]